MRDVSVVGVGMVPFVRRADEPSSALGARAVRAALADAGVAWADVDLAVVGAVGVAMSGAPALLHHLPRTGLAAHAVENASATGSTAFAEAYRAVGSGVADVAVAVGYGSLEAALASAMLGSGPPDLAAVAGANMAPIVFALTQSRRMARFGEDADASAWVAVKNHTNATHNPMAQRRKHVTLDDVRASPVIAEPMRRLECCPLGDGAAAVVVAAADGGRAVRVMSSVTTTDRWHPAAGFVPDPSATGRTAAHALGRAGVSPADLDVVEVHDAFALEELEYSEAIGLCGPGEAGEAVASGAFDIGGRVAVSPSGGLLARGHPGGATGLAQIVEIVEQLRGEAGERQQSHATRGLAHMIGAGGVCVVHVLGV